MILRASRHMTPRFGTIENKKLGEKTFQTFVRIKINSSDDFNLHCGLVIISGASF